MIAFVTSNDLIASYSKQMQEFKKGHSPHRVVIVSALSGIIHTRGKGGIRFEDAMIEELQQMPWFKQLRIHAALARGVILSEDHAITQAEIEAEIQRIPNIGGLFDRLISRQIDKGFSHQQRMKNMLLRLSKITGGSSAKRELADGVADSAELVAEDAPLDVPEASSPPRGGSSHQTPPGGRSSLLGGGLSTTDV